MVKRNVRLGVLQRQKLQEALRADAGPAMKETLEVKRALPDVRRHRTHPAAARGVEGHRHPAAVDLFGERRTELSVKLRAERQDRVLGLARAQLGVVGGCRWKLHHRRTALGDIRRNRDRTQVCDQERTQRREPPGGEDVRQAPSRELMDRRRVRLVRCASGYLAVDVDRLLAEF